MIGVRWILRALLWPVEMWALATLVESGWRLTRRRIVRTFARLRRRAG